MNLDPETPMAADDAAQPDGTEARAKRTCLLVLGMHRSGTSALTRVLSLMGAALPKTLLGANKGNETGHWESQVLVAHQERLLAELGSHWDDWDKLDFGRVTARRMAEFRSEWIGLLASEYGDAQLMVVKEPRLCRFAGPFVEATASGSGSIDCLPLLMLRNPLEVIESLERRDGMERGQAGLLWLRHTLDAESATRNSRRAIVSYEALLKDWRCAVSDLSEQLGVSFPFSTTDVTVQVESFLSPIHRHHTRNGEDLVHDPMLRNWIGEAYASLLVLAQSPDSRAAQGTLDRVRREFENATPVLRALLAEVRSIGAGEAARLGAKLQDRAAEAERLSALQAETAKAASDLAKALEASLQDIEAAKSAHISAVESARRTERLAAASHRELARLRTENAALATSASAALSDAAEINMRFAQIESDLFDSRRQSGNAKAPISRRLLAAALKPLAQRVPRLSKATTRMLAARRDRKYSGILLQSGLFDPNWYLTEYPDVRSDGMNPGLHYIRFGGREGRRPSPHFDGQAYLAANRDVATADLNPLLHYIVHGRREGRPLAPSDRLLHNVGTPLTLKSPGPTEREDRIVAELAYAISNSQVTDGRPRVLVLPAQFAVGGVERNTASIMKELSESYRFVVVTNEPHTTESGCLLDQIVNCSEAVFDLARKAPRADHLDHLTSICRRFPPDLVWVCNGSVWYHNNSAAICRLFASIPIVDQQIYDVDAGWINNMTPDYTRHVARFIAINQRIQDKIASGVAPSTRTDLIYPAVDVSRLAAAPLGEPSTARKASHTYALIGRLSPQKRPLDLIKAAKIIETKGATLKFLIVGDGPDARLCADQVAKLGLRNVSMHPFVEDVAKVYAEIDALVLVSEYEGLPVVMLEALASGIPVLATDVGDIERVSQMLGGGCVVMQDSIGQPERIAAALLAFDANLEAHTQSARAVSSTVRKKFSSKTLAAQYESSWICAWQTLAQLETSP